VAVQTRLVGVALCVLAARVVGCSASDDGSGTAEARGTSGSVGSGGSGAWGGSGATGGGLAIDGGLTGDGALTADSACVGETKQAEKIPLSMYILLDRSGSMTNYGSPKWSQAVNAINTFVSDQSLVAIKVALQAWSGQGPCDGSVYDTPAIPMSPVPASAPQIASWLSTLSPYGNTPTQGALLGLQKYTTQYASQNPGEKVIGLLVTDGLPTTCSLSQSVLMGIASNTFNGTPSILVYTMGMQGADFGLLDLLAQAGGTGKAFDATGGTQAFIDALQTISGSALSCEFEVPTPETGTLDPDKVNVEFTPTSGAAQPLYKVDNEAACVAWGWYYDDPIAPTRVILCPDTCNQVKQDTQGRIDLILGCKSNEPQ
jgi:hypothetical protein